MSKIVDLTKPLSDEDREYLKSRSRWYDIEENDRIFKRGKFAEAADPTNSPGSTEMAPKNLSEGPGSQPEDEGEDVSALTVEELKDELRKRDLSTSGNKDELISRLSEALEEE